MNLMLSEYRDAERGRLLALWAAALPLDAITEGILETRVLLDENFSPETFLLASRGDALAGFALGLAARRLPLGDADPDGTRCWITAFGVGPGEERETAGAELLSCLEDRFRKMGKKECLISTYPPGYFTPGVDGKAYPDLLRFFLHHGYGELKQVLSMDAPIVLFALPEKTRELERRLHEEGIAVRQYRPTDLLAFLGFLERSMPTDWVRVERANLKKLWSGGFSPEQITVVSKEEEIIGYCQFEGSHFGPFGVSEAYQGRGIGTVLLGRTLERMRILGYHNAWVLWTDDLAARVYAKFGFTQSRRFTILRKTL